MSSIIGIALAGGAALYSLGGWLGGRFQFNKSLSENYRLVKSNPPMPPFARILQILGTVVILVSVLCLILPTAKAAEHQLPPPVFGTTPAEIDALFPVIIDQNMRANGNFHAHNLKDEELANLAVLYQHANGSTASVLRILAENADADGLTHVAAAFGQDSTAAAVMRFSKPEVAAAFAASPRRAATPATISRALLSAPKTRSTSQGYLLRIQAPNLDMTLYEIYLNYRTLPVGSLSVSASLVQTSIYAGTNLSLAWGAGYLVGTGINSFINNYFPEAGIAIGDAIGGMVDALSWGATNNYTADNGMYECDINTSIQSVGGYGIPAGSAGDYSVYADGLSYSDSTSVGGSPMPQLGHPTW